jgi:hypothetical protein
MIRILLSLGALALAVVGLAGQSHALPKGPGSCRSRLAYCNSRYGTARIRCQSYWADVFAAASSNARSVRRKTKPTTVMPARVSEHHR